MSELNREQIIKGLEWCTKCAQCERCPALLNQHCNIEAEALSLIKELTAENEKIGIENFNLICELSRIKEDTVRKMQSAIKEYYSKSCYRPTQKHPVKHTQIEHLFYIVDQIAKELLKKCD